MLAYNVRGLAFLLGLSMGMETVCTQAHPQESGSTRGQGRAGPVGLLRVRLGAALRGVAC